MSSYAAQTTGMGFSAFGSLVQGQQTANQLDYNAQVQTNNANLALTAAASNAAKQSVSATRMLGNMSAGYAANGVTQTSGSVMAVMGASAANAELDRQNILYGGQVKAVNYENQASLDKTGATNAINASYFNALSSLVGGGAGMLGNTMGGGSSGSSGADATGSITDDANADGLMNGITNPSGSGQAWEDSMLSLVG